MLSLQDAVKLISSEKATERVMGIEQYKRIFSDNETLKKIDQSEDGEKKWLRLLQALFNCVIADRTTCIRRGQWQTAAPASKKRLQDSASMVLWMIERCNEYLESTTVVSTINHLTQMLDFRGELLEIISTYYLKALSVLLSHRTHVDHLELDLWRLCSSICFNVILHENLSDEPDCDEAYSILSAAVNRSKGDKSLRTRPEDLASARCIYSLVRSLHAPLVTSERQGAIALYRYAHILIEYPQESSLHLPILKGITHILSELSVNDSSTLLQFADLSWASLLALWSSRSQALKEQVILALRTLVPVLQYSNRIELLDSLCEEILCEANDRLSLQPLQLTHMNLRSSNTTGPFIYPNFQSSHRIDESSLISWSTLELGADLVAYLLDKHTSDEDSPQTAPTPSKRRKVRGGSVTIERGQVLSHVLNPLTSQSSMNPSKIIWHIQLLLFLISRSFNRVQRSSQDRILQVITETLSRGQGDINSWLFLCLTAATQFEAFQKIAKPVFQAASRQLMREPTTHSAAHLMQTMISLKLVERSEVLVTMSNISSEIDVQNIHNVCDATCALFTQSLSFAQSSMGTASFDLYDKVFSWLRQSWTLPQSFSTQRRSEGLFHELSCSDVVKLILAICRHPEESIDDSYSNPPMCSTSKWTLDQYNRNSIEKYVLFGELINSSNMKEPNVRHNSEIAAEREWRKPNQWEARGINYILMMVKKMAATLEEASTSSIILTFEQYRDTIELAKSGLFFISCLHDKGVKFDYEIKKRSFNLINTCLSLLIASQIPIQQKAVLIQSLSTDPLKSREISAYEAIQPPGRQSGVHSEQLVATIYDNPDPQITSRLSLKKLWSTEEALPILTAIQQVLITIINVDGNDDANQSMDPYDMDLNQMSNGLSGSLRMSYEDQNELGSSCIILLFPISIIRLPFDESQLNFLEELIDKAPTNLFLQACSTIFALLKYNSFVLPDEWQEKLIERMGTDVLATYQYERDVEGHLVGIEFLHSTMSSWLTVSSIQSKKSDKAIQLCLFFMRQFNKNHMHWTVENKFAAFMESFAETVTKEEGLQGGLPKLLRAQTIIKNLCVLNGRLDMRIRFQSSSLVARLFDVWGLNIGETEELYTFQEQSLPRNKEEVSQMASRILSLANICVASAHVRPYAFFHILEVCIAIEKYTPLATAAIKSISHLLGYPDVRRFWLSFAYQLVQALISREYSLDQMDPVVCGYKSKEEWAEDSFNLGAAPLIESDEAPFKLAFTNLCKYIKLSEKDGLKRCMPSLIAHKAIILVQNDQSPSNVRDQLAAWIGKLMRSDDHIKLLNAQLSLSLDEIVVEVLLRWYEPDKEAMDKQIQERCPLFSKLISAYIIETDNYKLFQPSEPRANTNEVLTSLAVLSHSRQNATSSETAYNVIHHLSGIIYQDYSLNDQLRHLCALQAYIAIAWSTISKSPVILRLILQTCLSCLEKQDLVGTIAVLLCACIQSASAEMYDFSQLIVAISSKLCENTLSHNRDIKNTSLSLLKRIEDIMEYLYEDESMRRVIRMASCSWPRPIPEALSNLMGPLSTEDLIDCISHSKTINVQTLQILSQTIQHQKSLEKMKFSKNVLWRIAGLMKENACLSVTMKGDLMTNFAQLALQYEGKLQTPPVKVLQMPPGTETLTKKVREIRELDENTTVKTLPLQQWITTYLICKVQSTNLSEARIALYTLRRIFYQQSSFNGTKKQTGYPATIFQEELRLVNAFSPPQSSEKSNMDARIFNLQTKEKSKDLKKWSQWLCVSLLQHLKELDSSLPYYHLIYFAERLADNAIDLLPCIIHVFYRVTKQKQFQKISKLLSSHLNDVLQYEQASNEVWKLIIRVVLQLREDPPDALPFSGNEWIEKLNWMVLASRAVKVGLYASALLFLELHWTSSPTQEERDEDETSLELQYAIYSNIEDPDSFYGIRNNNVRDSLERRLQHEGRWDRVFSVQAADYEASNSQFTRSKMKSTLHQLNLSLVAKEIGNGEDSVDYEMGWRKQDWDLPLQRGQGMNDSSKGLYSALRALHQDQNVKLAQETINLAIASQYENVIKIDVESSTGAKKVIRGLLGMREIQQFEAERAENVSFKQMEFDIFETLSYIKLSLLQSKRKGSQVHSLIGGEDLTDIDDALEKESILLTALSERAREEGKIQIAINATTQAQYLIRNVQDATKTYRVEEEFANVLWMQGDHSIATDAMFTLIKKMPEKGTKASRIRRAHALTRLGQWRAIARFHQARLVSKECFRPALRVLDEIKASDDFSDVAYKYAIFADDQYRELSASREIQELEKAVSLRQEEIRQLDSEIIKYNSTTKKTAQYRNLEEAKKRANAILQIDTASLSDHYQSKEFFRRDAIENFIKELSISSERNDGALMRFTALWFENALDGSLNSKLSTLLKRIPSWKFLPIVRQISSRLNKESLSNEQHNPNRSSSPAFQSAVFDTVLRMAIDHPFHALYPLYALYRGSKETENEMQKRKRGSRSSLTMMPSATQIGCSDTAFEIMERARLSSKHQQRILAWQNVCDACVEWAQLDLPKALPKEFGPKTTPSQKGKIPTQPRIPAHLRIHKIRNVDVPIITKSLPIDITGKYASFVSIAYYSDRFSTAGGVHLPKITDCMGSNGKTYRQLFKDRDDLRQDAVMQQVFTLVNDLLNQDRRARQRSLQIRTYSVVPLGPQYGLLEFVGSTVPLLLPLRQLYVRHHKEGQLTPAQAREEIFKCQGESVEEKSRKFEEICKKMPPVFRFYFLQMYTNPMALLQSRLNYTRSVATSSIVGHILGLGDRHSSNILLDQQTGEVIHIDFGVAFDQGRLLPIPELVPFRLTRNIVDGMGLNGVEGVFRCGCEETLRVLRSGASVINTVLEVFRFDPLYDWTKNPIKVIQAQGYDGNDGDYDDNEVDGSRSTTLNPNGLSNVHNGVNGKQNKEVAEMLAERAINSVMEKLSNHLSVEYTVNALMNRARDSANLGAIFHGWQAAL